MAEPTSSTTVAITAGAGLISLLPFVNGDALFGAVIGAALAYSGNYKLKTVTDDTEYHYFLLVSMSRIQNIISRRVKLSRLLLLRLLIPMRA